MSNAFPPVTIDYNGEQLTVPSNAVWGLIGAIEDHVTYVKLATMLTRGELPRYKISEAMAAALRYAGKQITAEQFCRDNDMNNIVHYATALGAILRIAEKPVDFEMDEVQEDKTQGKVARAKAPSKSAK